MVAQAPARGEEPPVGYDALLRIDKLPLLADWPAYQDSSYSRKNDNNDAGNFLRVEPNGEQVMMDTDGPGYVTRIWSTGVVGTQMSDKCRFLFYFDGEEKPRLDLSAPELFGDKGSKYPFVPPLCVTFESGAANNPAEGPCNLCYVPIPFAKHLKVTGRNIAFYHIDYVKLPKKTEVTSWTQKWAEGQKEKHEKAAAMFKRVGEHPTHNQKVSGNKWGTSPIVLAAGKTVKKELVGPAVIDSLTVELENPTPRKLRGVSLRITFDDAKGPSVLAPLGDFFGTGCGDRRFKTIMCGMIDQGYYSYWPMPFAKSARVEIVNDTDEPVKVKSFSVASSAVKNRFLNTGYFHAQYVQNRDCAIGKDYTILEVKGHRGKYVGVNITMQNTRGAQGLFFLEGDEKIYCDGEKWPSRWLGTGTEDYYNGAYFWNHPNKKDMVRPLGGLTFLDWGIGRVCAYRWHIPDCINFKKEIRVDQEHGGTNEIPTNYQSVAYYYLDAPTAQKSLPPLKERLPVTNLPPAPAFMGCALKGPLSIGGKKLVARKFSEVDAEFDGADDAQHFASVHAGKLVDGTLTVPGEDVFQPAVYLTAGPQYGKVDILLDGKRIGSADCNKNTLTPWVKFAVKEVRLAGGDHRLQFKVTGVDQATAVPHFGLVAVQLKPTSPLVKQWSVIGTWPCPKEGGWAMVHPPEKEQKLDAVYEVKGQGKVTWKPVTQETVHFSGDWRVGYGLTYVWSPDERSVGCFLGKDDALKVWVNDKVVYDSWGWSHLIPDSYHCSITLRKGWNKLLVKNANWFGGFGYCVRLGDPDRQLKYARQPQP